ncbi:hypothetical protein [Sphingomonas dokdonensis]|uniref:Uncharacterized protein n=1 Tax=Sphingomonas dokdonensis TaxID=344880 RepID=A0A245ZNQ5_9SPHN|nr:hypothetical protein [Sphingomonas dokdonensis]OWK31372.1 hypothetical protein SPDO_13810 [Sphingomonas dokdonensis]
MTTTPPVPPANTSPFPIEEPPHTPTAPTASKSSSDEWATPEKQGWSIGKIVGAAAGVGAIAIGVAAVLFPRDSAASSKKTKKRKS